MNERTERSTRRTTKTLLESRTAVSALVRNNDIDADFEGSDNDASTSEGSMPKLLIRKEHACDNNFEKEQKWENLSGTDNEMCDMQDAKIDKDKVKLNQTGSRLIVTDKYFWT